MSEAKALFGLLRGHLRPMLAAAAVATLTSLAVVGLMAVSTKLLAFAAVTGLVASSTWPPVLHQLNAGVRFFVVVRTLGRYGERVFGHDTTFRILADLRVWFFRHLAPLAPARLYQYRSGELVERLVGDIDALATFFLRVLAPGAMAALTTLAVTGFLALFDIRVAFVTAIGLVVMTGFLPGLAYRRDARWSRQLTQARTRLRAGWVETVDRMTDAVVWNILPVQLEGLTRDHQHVREIERRRHHILGNTMAGARLLIGAGVTAALWLGAQATHRGSLDPSLLALVGLVAWTAYELLLPLATSFHDLRRSQESMHHLGEVLDAPPAVRQAEAPQKAPSDTTVEFHQVSFCYPGRTEPVLRAVQLVAGPGTRTAILGPTGSGKSTLGHLLVRFWDPTAGTISLGGTDLRQLAEADLRRLVTSVPQRPDLFSGTLRDNLALGRPAATPEMLQEVLRLTQLEEWLATLPEGLRTTVGEGGAPLSGGQIRRLALARALLRNTPVLLLDEPTEDLDHDTAERLLEGLFEATSNKTLIVITHSTAWLDRFDHLWLLEQGQLRLLAASEGSGSRPRPVAHLL